MIVSAQLLEDAASGVSLNFLDSPSTCKAVGRALPTLSAQVTQTLFFAEPACQMATDDRGGLIRQPAAL